jgi:hypothetical protein
MPYEKNTVHIVRMIATINDVQMTRRVCISSKPLIFRTRATDKDNSAPK